MKKFEWILIASILIVSLILWGALSLFKESGASVVVRVDGKDVATYSLLKNGEYVLNGGTNVLTIKDGCAYMTQADCPDHLCVKQGSVERTGETITCLPNRLTVTVFGAGKSEVELVVD